MKLHLQVEKKQSCTHKSQTHLPGLTREIKNLERVGRSSDQAHLAAQSLPSYVEALPVCSVVPGRLGLGRKPNALQLPGRKLFPAA